MPESGTQPRKRRSLRTILAFTLAVAACDAPSAPTEPDPELPAGTRDFVTLMNAHRVEVGCSPLIWNARVAEVAQAHSEDMVARKFFGHDNPEGDSPFDRLEEAGVAYSRAAENIAYGFPDAGGVLEGWLDSPGHRANIENCTLTEHGVGLENTHWTHLFIRP
jgi:uncharacterized protein YkwD